MQRLAREQGINFRRGHLEALVPAQRSPHVPIEREVRAARQPLESDALTSPVKRGRQRGLALFEVGDAQERKPSLPGSGAA